jgi:hypothetical protein
VEVVAGEPCEAEVEVMMTMMRRRRRKEMLMRMIAWRMH